MEVATHAGVMQARQKRASFISLLGSLLGSAPAFCIKSNRCLIPNRFVDAKCKV
jgi:hypothetical protein